MMELSAVEKGQALSVVSFHDRFWVNPSRASSLISSAHLITSWNSLKDLALLVYIFGVKKNS